LHVNHVHSTSDAHDSIGCSLAPCLSLSPLITLRNTRYAVHRFREFLECQQRQDLDLQMRLTLPLNHIAMYERLLRRITEHTSHEDPDLQCLMGALTIMEETANFIRNSLAQADNRASLMRIQRSLYVPPGVRMQNLLSTTHRNFVKELHLEFQRPPGSSAAAPPAASSSTPRSSGSASPLASGHVFLFSDIVVLTRSLAHAATTKATPATQANISTALYQVEWQYSLDRTIIAEVSSTSFSIAETSESGSEVPESTYHLVFAQAPKAHEWYSTLRESIEHNQPNRGILTRSLAPHLLSTRSDWKLTVILWLHRLYLQCLELI